VRSIRICSGTTCDRNPLREFKIQNSKFKMNTEETNRSAKSYQILISKAGYPHSANAVGDSSSRFRFSCLRTQDLISLVNLCECLYFIFYYTKFVGGRGIRQPIYLRKLHILVRMPRPYRINNIKFTFTGQPTSRLPLRAIDRQGRI